MRRSLLVALAITASAWTATGAQDKPAAAPPAPAPAAATGPRIPLKVQFVLSRYLGEKKVSSLPYVLGVLSNAQTTNLRMGIQVPIATSIVKAETAFPSYQYKDVGTNIDCQARDAGNGQYTLTVTVSDSSIHLDTSKADGNKTQIVRDVPAFRSFHASFAMLLRDGQTMQYASATDPISGEVMRIDVTLNLAK